MGRNAAAEEGARSRARQDRLRYQARDITSLVCPPFDVISAGQQAELYARDPHNVIRLELTRADPNEAPGAKYERAAHEQSIDHQQTLAIK